MFAVGFLGSLSNTFFCLFKLPAGACACQAHDSTGSQRCLALLLHHADIIKKRMPCSNKSTGTHFLLNFFLFVAELAGPACARAARPQAPGDGLCHATGPKGTAKHVLNLIQFCLFAEFAGPAFARAARPQAPG